MKTLELLEVLRASGVSLAADGDRLKVAAPKGTLTEELRSAIAARRSELLQLLGGQPADPPLRPRDPVGEARLSPGQERLWSLVSNAPPNARYNLPLAFLVSGALDLSALQEAVAGVANRHEVLRSNVVDGPTGPVLRIAETQEWPAISTENAPAGVDREWMTRTAMEEAKRPFDLTSGPLLRLRVFVMGPGEHLLILVMHHFVADGWSFEIFFDELESNYRCLLEGRSLSGDPLAVQYSDVAAWQRERLETRRPALEAFWRSLYEGDPSPLALPPAKAGPDERMSARIPGELVAQIDELASSEGCTPYVVFLAAYTLFLAAITGTTDLILCSPTAGREREELRGLVGYLNNVLPLRLRVESSESFPEHLRRTRDAVLHAQRHQDLPFQHIATLPEVARTRLTRGMFAYHGQPLRALRLTRLEVESIPVSAGSADFDLALSVDGTPDGAEATLTSRPRTLDGTSSKAFLAGFVQLLHETLARPEQRTSALMDSVDVTVTRGASKTSSGRPVEPTLPASAPLPRDPLELQVAVIWERILGVRNVAPTDDFFALGGHSLLAVELLDTVQREMGHRLPLTVLTEQPTVRGFTRAIQGQGWSPPSGSLVPLDVRVDGTPVVMIHSFEGHLFLFNELARRLGDSHPVFGLQAAGLDGSGIFHNSVEEMAAHYLDLLDAQFGDAAVVLVAMCFGFSVGLEMASRLQDTGRDVELVLIDGAWDHLMEPEDLGVTPGLAHTVARAIQWRTARVRTWWTETLRRASLSPYARREASIRRRTAAAWYQYTPQPYSGSVTSIRAQETAENPEKQWHERAMKTIARGQLHTVVVPGHHFTILREPFVSGVAAEIQRAADRLSR